LPLGVGGVIGPQRSACQGVLREWRASVLPYQAGVAHLLHLIEQGHATDKLLPSHLPQRTEVDMPESGVPKPRILLRVRRQAHWPCNVGVEHVEPAWAPVNFGE
jgi:hypothetical protein